MLEIAGGILLAIVFIVFLPMILRGAWIAALVLFAVVAVGLVGWLVFILAASAWSAPWSSITWGDAAAWLIAIAFISVIGFWPKLKPLFTRH